VGILYDLRLTILIILASLGCRTLPDGDSFSNLLNEDDRPQWEADEHPPHLRNPKIDVQNYDIDMTVPKMEAVNLPVTLAMKVKLVSAAPDLKLHAHATSLSVQQITVDGTDATFAMIQGKPGSYGLDGSFLKIDLAGARPAGTILDLKITYEITPALMGTDKGMQFRANYAGEPVFATRSWPYYARFWLPGNDHPYDTASFKFTIHVPDGTVAAANGRLTEGTYQSGSGLDPADLRVFKWEQATPIPTYGVNITVGNLEIQEQNICFDASSVNNDVHSCALPHKNQVPFVYYSQSQLPNRDQFKAKAEVGIRSMVFFSSLLDPYAYKKLGFVTAPQPFNMESVSLVVMISPEATTHEVAHHWWGNTVYIKHWGDFWISEGFTTYFTGLYDQHFAGQNTACEQSTGVLNNHPDTDPMKIFDNTAYCKGASAIRDLRARLALEIGKPEDDILERQLFYNLMNQLFHTYKFRRLGSEDLPVFLRQSLPSAFARIGHNIPAPQIDALVSAWQQQWLPAP
jgi:aminopeptidase N